MSSKRTIGTEVKLTGEKEFNDQMKAMNNGLKTLRSDMAAVSAEFDGNSDSVEALTAKQKVLQESVQQHQAKVDALRAQYEKAAKVLGENAAKTQKYRQQLNFATVAHVKEKAALEKVSDALEKATSESEKYIPITQRMAAAIKRPSEDLKGLRKAAAEVAKETPFLAEAMDIAKVAGKGLSLSLKGVRVAGTSAAKGIGTAAGGIAKGVGSITAASIKASAAITALAATAGTIAITSMVGFAKEAAEAARTAYESGETLTESQQMWLAFSDQLGSLDAAAASAKSALGGILLPVLSDLSTEGAAFLNDFARDMEAAAGDSAMQGQILSEYIVRGARLIKEKLPEYLQLGKELLSGLGEGLSESGPELLEIGTDLVMDLLDGIIESAPQLAQGGLTLIEKLIGSLVDRGPDLVTSAVGMVTQIITGLAQAAPKLIPVAFSLVTQLITALIESAPQLLLAGLELIYGIISGIVDGLGDLINSADEIIDTIVDAFADKADDFLALGSKIIEGIWNGIQDGKEWLFNLISGWVNDVVDWIKDKFGIGGSSSSSASGKNRVSGTRYQTRLQHINDLMLEKVDTSFHIPGFGSRFGQERTYTTSSGRTVNLYFYAKTITEADINMVVEIVNRKLGDAM